MGHKSSIQDAIGKHGKPDRISESTVSKHEEYPDAQETRISYDALGISFVFVNDELSQICVTNLPRR